MSEYGKLSNHKINWSKSTALNITLDLGTVATLKSNFAFPWAPSSLKYLGIHIPADPSKTYDLNFPPLLAAIKQDLTKWERKDFSWIGRINIVKMNVLPRLLYLFQAIPICLPRAFFVLLTKLISLFVWAQGRPRIAKSTLVRPKLRGGLAVPDFKAYFVAAATTRILDWFHRRSSKLWVHLESLLSITPLTALPWLPRRVISKSDLSTIPFVAAATLNVCRTYIPRNGLFSPDGPLTPVRGHPSLAISVLLNSPLLPDPGQPFMFRQILTSSSLKSYEELVPVIARSFLMQLNYSRLNFFL